MASQLPFTELPNELTKELDVIPVPEMFSSLSACDDQLFSGWGPEGEKKSIYSKEMIETLEKVIEKMVPVCARALNGDKKMSGTVQVGGCGTSGRLAFFLCQKYNKILEKAGYPPIFQYLIAGGDRALVTAVEQAEDVPGWGKNDLHLEEGKEEGVPRVYFGVSCGLSAAYVAGQLFSAREDDRYVCVSAIGFNPVELGKEAPLCCDGKDTSFHAIVNEMAKEQKEQGKESRSFVLNPIVGPEGITGSTRMKGGTMTKIILDVLFFSSLMKALDSSLCPPLSSLLKLYQQGVQNSYIALKETKEGEKESQGEKALKLVKEALTRGGEGEGKKEGKVYYVTDCYSAGVVGLIDASECPPTFGAKRDDFGCYVNEGFDTIALSASSPLRTDTILNIDLATLLQKATSGQFNPSDIIVILQQSPSPSSALVSAIETLHSISSPPPTVLIKPTSSPPSPLDSLSSVHLQIPPPSSSLPSPPSANSFASLLWEGGVGGGEGGLGGGIGEVSLKVVLNVLSTLGHVLVGKVAGNRMIDVAVSNNKLYFRAVRIISDVGGVEGKEAERCLLRSVYGVDELREEIWKDSVEKRIELAQKRKRVTPRAILLARKCQTVAEADALLLKEPIVRKLF